MSVIDFKGKAEAEAWKKKLVDLNNRTDATLKNLSVCIEEIKTESAGDPVDQLVKTAAEILAAAAEVIEGLRGLEDAIDKIIKLLIQAIAEAAQRVIDDRFGSTNL